MALALRASQSEEQVNGPEVHGDGSQPARTTRNHQAGRPKSLMIVAGKARAAIATVRPAATTARDAAAHDPKCEFRLVTERASRDHRTCSNGCRGHFRLGRISKDRVPAAFHVGNVIRIFAHPSMSIHPDQRYSVCGQFSDHTSITRSQVNAGGLKKRTCK